MTFLLHKLPVKAIWIILISFLNYVYIFILLIKALSIIYITKNDLKVLFQLKHFQINLLFHVRHNIYHSLGYC